MKRDDIRSLMFSKGFAFEKATKSYPSRRGDEDIYTHKPDFKYTFRVSRIDENSHNYGLYVGMGNQFRRLDAIVEHDVDVANVWNSNSPLPMWTGDNFKKLMEYFSSETGKQQSWSKKNDDELITVILPIINNG